MAVQKLNTARGTRHIRIKDDGKTVFISEEEFQRAKRDGETVKRARTTDAAGGSKSGGSKSGGSKSGSSKRSSSKSGSSKRSSSKSGGGGSKSDDNFFSSMFANMR